MEISSELLQVVAFLEEEFYMQWHMDNDPHSVFQFFDGSCQPHNADTIDFLRSMIEFANSKFGGWENYNPSEMEDWVQDYRILKLGYPTLTALKTEMDHRRIPALYVGV